MSGVRISTSADNSVAYINGRVYTVNKAKPWAEAFIVTPDGKFGIVGSTTEVLDKAKATGMVVQDLKAAFIMPGIHDAHVHSLQSGARILNWAELPEGTTLQQTPQRLAECACACQFQQAYQDWIVGATLHVDDYDRSVLDQDFPDRPVLLWGHGSHHRYLNTTALERAGYDIQNEPVPPYGEILRREDGSLTGELRGQAGDRASAAIPVPPMAHIKRIMQRAVVELHKNGVTSCQDAAASKVMLEALRELDSEGRLKMQFATHILYKNAWLTGEVMSPPDKLILDSEKYRTTHVDTRFVKLMMDGVPAPPVFSHSELDANGKPNMSKILLPDIDEVVEKFDAMGLTCKVHAMGHGGSTMTLDAFERVRRNNPNGPRHEIAHCSCILPDDFARFKKLNVGAEMSPAGFFDYESSGLDFPLIDWDFERMVAEGNHATIGSDWSYGMPLPILPAVAIVARKVGTEKTLEMITLAGARATNREKDAGSIETGKVANFINVDRDLSKGGFKDAKVLRTWFEGELVFDGLKNVCG
ncbi:hypothetical protein FOPG_17014 [Fusarium oxysporum f. sp. conglutinans race 2 54008]|uniref:Amidohydrolase 3 domain-containing protein n=1 Tax=Fusarium oxysporum f. sp. conglutinans race 2 54008 TaxID=1089457 RepID=X0GTY1_FUSOX|nr:hypothetical protein FOPG_17014 [Fusarium oxysporum f. sp. conglutinans race 2 54008]KAG6989154.1 N-substituted formamide deformylase [Fusarium oxysporum f. sp. conglutinans]